MFAVARQVAHHGTKSRKRPSYKKPEPGRSSFVPLCIPERQLVRSGRYAQHRGGPKGFICVLDDTTLGFADFAGNRQYVTTGNLGENDRAFLFLMDYAHRRRIKLWGRARAVEGNDALMARVMPPDYPARPEQAILFTVEAWDMNCSQHIPQKFNAADVANALQGLQSRLDAAEAETARLRAELASHQP